VERQNIGLLPNKLFQLRKCISDEVVAGWQLMDIKTIGSTGSLEGELG